MALTRRSLLRGAIGGAGVALSAPFLRPLRLLAGDAPPALGPADANGVCLPPGYTSRIVARAGQPPLPGGTFSWVASPDGGAVYPAPGGGWIYVANSELPSGQGGAAALRFDADGAVVDAYPVLTGTSINCGGGATPWGTWLSGEEFPLGQIWECDPTGAAPAVARPALGVFTHEAVAVDPVSQRLYLTEDAPYGRFYRFTPRTVPATGAWDLSAGTLEAARVHEGSDGISGPVTWLPVADPAASKVPLFKQVPASTAFPGAEGIATGDGMVYFTTKYDSRVWAYDVRREAIGLLYDARRFAEPVLTGVDNVVLTPGGAVLVAEDGGDMQLVVVVPGGAVYPIAQVVGHIGSELAGPAFDPSGTRLYFSSQRGPGGQSSDGITYEVRGPFAG